MPAAAGLARRIGAQPILLGQAFSSAAGALAMVLAAAAMPPSPFTFFSLLTLITVITTGAVRATLFQPALIEMRNNRNAHIHARSALVGAACAGAVFATAAAVLGVHEPLWLAVLGTTGTLPVIADWLRMRGIAMDHRWDAARGDAIRLAVTLAGPLVLWASADAKLFVLFVNLTYLTSLGYLWYRLPAVTSHVAHRELWRPASSQLLDFLIGQAVATIPLFVLGGLGSSVYLGGVRLAQTLLGPLNLVFAASTVNLMADGATRQSHSTGVNLIKRGRRLATKLSVLSLVLVATLIAFLYLTHFSLRGVDNLSLIVGTALVGVLAITSGFSGMDAIIMRLLGHHAIPTVGRTILVAVSALGYAAGYLAGGVDLSLIVGFVCAAVANPVAFVLPATGLYRRYSSSDHADGMAPR
jgi:hypothetical protein